MTPRSRVETITPEMAAKWLERNESNRKLRPDRVDDLVRDIKSGNFMLSGDPIRFDTNGNLIDGQHRLWACVLADQNITTYVIRGLDPEVKTVLDSGIKRTLGDTFDIIGETGGPLLAGIVNICWKYDKDGWTRNTSPTRHEAMEWLEENTDVRLAPGIAYKVRHGLALAPSPVGAAYYLNARIDAAAAEQFWTSAGTGIGLTAGDPILAFRRWVNNMLAARYHVTTKHQFAFHMKAMQQWRTGKAVKVLQWRTEEGLPEPWKK